MKRIKGYTVVLAAFLMGGLCIANIDSMGQSTQNSETGTTTDTSSESSEKAQEATTQNTGVDATTMEQVTTAVPSVSTEQPQRKKHLLQ